MAKRKSSESRKHDGMIRVTKATRARAAKAAGMLGLTLADYADDVLAKAAERDIKRDARKELKGDEE